MTIILRDYEVPNCPVKALAQDYTDRLDKLESIRLRYREAEDLYNETLNETKQCETHLVKLVGSNCVSVSNGRILVANQSYNRIELKQCIK